MAAPALVALAHGSRDPRSAATVTALVNEVKALRPDLGHEGVDGGGGAWVAAAVSQGHQSWSGHEEPSPFRAEELRPTPLSSEGFVMELIG